MSGPKPTLVLDFDGVCHSYVSGWQGIDQCPDPPVPGLFEFLAQAMQVFAVAIYSSRSAQRQGREAMMDWFMKAYGEWLPMPEGPEKAARVFGLIRDLAFPESKPPAHVTLDDRALTFEGRWPALDELLAFQPWYRR